MFRIAIGVVVILFVIKFFISAPSGTEHISLAPPPSSGSFSESGTIAYSPNSSGREIPYLVYRLPGGSVATKAMVFGNGSECTTQAGTYPCPLIADALHVYVGPGVVEVVGKVVAEHVVVERLRGS